MRAQTAVAAPPLVPEIRLHLATQITPLWEATEASLAAANVAPPYWAFAWPGGQALSRYLLDRPDSVRGRRVLDFAAGCGIGAIAAARAGAAAVVASDIDAIAIAVIAINAALNGVTVATTTADLTREPDARWDTVIAGDVCYESAMAARMVPWLERAAAAGSVVLLGDPGRAYLPAGLRRVASYRVQTTRELESTEQREVAVYRMGPG